MTSSSTGKQEPAIVVIGGGTGSFTLLQALKKLTPNITALVNMVDDGGSTGVLRDELGVLPPGDVRQCLVALSDAPQEMRDLFNFRFGEGAFKGHSFGNIFLSAVEKMTDDFADAVRMAGDVLRIEGSVVPITLTNCRLVLDVNGEKIVGEYQISEMKLTERPALSLDPVAKLNPQAAKAIAGADLVVIAPGNLYASLIPALLVDGLDQAIRDSKAPLAYVCNLVNRQHQTTDYAVHDYASEIERFVGQGQLDYVLYNVDEPNEELLARYSVKGEYPVGVVESELTSASYKAVPGNFLSRAVLVRNPNDTLIKRSLIRHDADAVALAIKELLG